MKYSNPLTLLCQIISYFKLSVNISVTGKSELCFPFQACINMPNKQAEHASLMGQCEVPLLGDYKAARHRGEGLWQPHLAAGAEPGSPYRLSEWMNWGVLPGEKQGTYNLYGFVL